MGVGERLGFRVFLIALLCFTGAYAVLLVLARRISADRRAARWSIVLVGTLGVIVCAGPILFSTDVFSYIAYARMGVLHGIDPYLHGPMAANTDGDLQVRGRRLAQSGDRVRPAVHAALLPAGAAGAEGRGVGREGRWRSRRALARWR